MLIAERKLRYAELLWHECTTSQWQGEAAYFRSYFTLYILHTFIKLHLPPFQVYSRERNSKLGQRTKTTSLLICGDWQVKTDLQTGCTAEGKQKVYGFKLIKNKINNINIVPYRYQSKSFCIYRTHDQTSKIVPIIFAKINLKKSE